MNTIHLPTPPLIPNGIQRQTDIIIIIIGSLLSCAQTAPFAAQMESGSDFLPPVHVPRDRIG